MKQREVYKQLLDEVTQRHRSRRPALCAIEEAIGRRVISFFVSFTDTMTMIEDSDADILEEALRQFDPQDPRGLTMVLNAPGGDGLAAERIVRVCRTYSRGDFEVIIPRMAKSAATMICFGANRIWMSETAELGPVDPQVGFLSGDRYVRISARELIQSYELLLAQAESCQGNLEPYVQQLGRFDARLVETYRSAEALSESIAVNLLRCAMLHDLSEDEVKERVRPFLEVNETRSHARAIYHERAQACGLAVSLFDIQSDMWQHIWELYLRSTYAVDNTGYSKLFETVSHSYVADPKEAQPQGAQSMP